MSFNSRIPDYDLGEQKVVTNAAAHEAPANPLRSRLIELVLERAAAVTEMAAAVGRPKKTVAHHVQVIVAARLLRVVWTRRVRAIEERCYGRVARTISIGALTTSSDKRAVLPINGLSEAAAEAEHAHANDERRCLLVRARVPAEYVREFWLEVQALARQFGQIPRGGGRVYGFAAGLYPTEVPTLAPVAEEA
ncbi:hypothetical protein GCM10025867_05140 [Frondihabitans sucicola]|uniref:ArsR family transcriptional regulator n=1 Tax=Frondihabitans sucicola TaxID=1268041 RepID=A0ABM8GIQ9_9MICO|nr:ArsR family transcriptional regulator [Frondihabitans sucicola]BDZ48273.1 hypothetical protein GCM10025867_05140 [Frondihabitans sucicola]